MADASSLVSESRGTAVTDDPVPATSDNEAGDNEPQTEQQEEAQEEEAKVNPTANSTVSNDDNSQITVAVTGASGFIGSHCIKQLLEKGYNVRGTVRGDPESDRYQWIYDISSKLNIPNKVKLYQADLLKNGSFVECFKDCDYIFHVASPFWVNIDDPLKDLLEPARNGTLNVLNCALNASPMNGKLKRIVITSSVAAVTGYDVNPNKLYTEKDWNDSCNLGRGPYQYSKTEAERAAWNWMDSNKTKVSFDIVTVNPGLVLGRHLNPGLSILNESNDILCRIINGAFPVRLNVAFTIVDVRDVAASHIFLIEGDAKTSASGRHLCINQYMPVSFMMDICEEYCKKRGINASIPCCRCDCKCCWCFIMCLSCCQPPAEADYVRSAVNKGVHYSNAKLSGMGFEFRDYDSTMIYTLDYLTEAGFIPK